jgi:acyl dehydratase
MAAVGRTAVAALAQRFAGISALASGSSESRAVPAPTLNDRVPSPSAALVRDYVRSVGGDGAAYRSKLPPHLFPQWAFPVLARTLDDLPFPLLRVVNGGCRLTMNAPLPIGERLQVQASLVGIENKGRKAVLHQRAVTGTASMPDALIADIFALVPTEMSGANGANGATSNGHAHSNGHAGPNGAHKDKQVAMVPSDVRELAYWRLSPDAGLSYALLTGDINPVHWLRPYAQAFGFRSTILHGFATLARTVEGLNRGLFAGAVDRLASIDVRFTRPLVLPARVGLYLGAGNTIFVGDAPGGFAYMTGSFRERTPT